MKKHKKGTLLIERDMNFSRYSSTLSIFEIIISKISIIVMKINIQQDFYPRTRHWSGVRHRR